MRRTASLARLSLLPALALGIAACPNEDVPATDDTTSAGDGIDTLSDGESSSVTADDSTTEATAGTAGEPDCFDGAHNGDETDVDCGGSCHPCDDGQGCAVLEDCYSLVCDGGVCQSATCYDTVQNGSEDGVDCGGDCPNACGGSGGCEDDNDCAQTEFCNAGVCEPAACDNGVLDSHESDVDCGGIDCPDCSPGDDCKVNADCDSHICDPKTMTCAAPACDDGHLNGDETDIDCGGACDPCGNTLSCVDNSDCVSGICENGNCQAPGCNDGVQNGEETDEDCGGTCADCPDGGGCSLGTDCQSGVCTGGSCALPACDDAVQNGDETDVDCGGTCGATCTTGEDCFDAGDCAQGVCEFGHCSAPDCLDGVLNGDETDLDCGGTCGASCEVGESCLDGGDCIEQVCENNLCSAPDCFDGLENGDETDVDCGASCGPTCITGDQCIADDDCVSDVCTLNTCQAPSCSDATANGDELGIDCEGSCPNPCDIGGEDTVNTYTTDLQLAPTIGAAPGGNYYVVAWSSVASLANAGQDGDDSGVYAQMFDNAGQPFGTEFRVNTTTAGAQRNPSVAVYDSGFVVTWESPDGDSTGVFAKRYDSGGNVATAEFQVNASNTGIQRRPDIAADNGGAFVICYDDRPVASFEVMCQRYNSSAVAQGAAIQVNATTSGDQQLPAVGRASNGNWTVAWQSSNDQDGDGFGVYHRRFNNAGTALAGETAVNTTTTANQSQPSISVNPNGAFVIAWTSDNQDGDGSAVVARRYNSSGVAQAGEVIVNTYTSGSQNNPTVALNGDGDYMIAWVSANQDGNLTGVYGQRYDLAGAAVGVEFRVNLVTTAFQEEPEITIRGADEPIVAYSSGSAADRNVFVRRFNGNFP